MTSLVLITGLPRPVLAMVDTLELGVRGVAGAPFGLQRLPTEPVGTLNLTLTNLINGSSIQIETQDGSTTLHNSTVTGTSKTITLSVYAPGNSRNDLRIKVRKGSAAPYYQPWETLATAVAGASSIYVAQISDQ